MVIHIFTPLIELYSIFNTFGRHWKINSRECCYVDVRYAMNRKEFGCECRCRCIGRADKSKGQRQSQKHASVQVMNKWTKPDKANSIAKLKGHALKDTG